MRTENTMDKEMEKEKDMTNATDKETNNMNAANTGSLVAITCEHHGGGMYSAPFSVKAVPSFEDVARQEAEECAAKNAVLSADGREPGWDVEPFNLGDMTGDLFVSCGGKPQYLVQVRRIG